LILQKDAQFLKKISMTVHRHGYFGYQLLD
jgi:hypothetical protein